MARSDAVVGPHPMRRPRHQHANAVHVRISPKNGTIGLRTPFSIATGQEPEPSLTLYMSAVLDLFPDEKSAKSQVPGFL